MLWTVAASANSPPATTAASSSATVSRTAGAIRAGAVSPSPSCSARTFATNRVSSELSMLSPVSPVSPVSLAAGHPAHPL